MLPSYPKFTLRQVNFHGGFTTASQIAPCVQAIRLAGRVSQEAPEIHQEQPEIHVGFTKRRHLLIPSQLNSRSHRRYTVSKSQEPVRTDLTDARKAELSTKTGKDADAVELS